MAGRRWARNLYSLRPSAGPPIDYTAVPGAAHTGPAPSRLHAQFRRASFTTSPATTTATATPINTTATPINTTTTATTATATAPTMASPSGSGSEAVRSPDARASHSASPLPPDAPPPPSKTRARRTLACAICRQRKLKCDRRTPACGMCVSRGQAHRCTYTDDPLPPSPSSPPAAALWLPVAEPIYQRVNRLESILTRAIDHLNTSGPPAPPAHCAIPTTGTAPALADKRALAQQVTSSVLYPSFWVSLTTPTCADAVLHAISFYPPHDVVRRSCHGYFDSVADALSVVSPPSFEAKLPSHEAFIERARAGNMALERSDVDCLTLVLAVTMTGFVFSPDPGLYQWFFDACQGRPLHTFMEAILRLLHAVDFRSRPTIETVRIEIVATFVLALSPNLWSPSVMTAGLIQEGLATQLHLDPPPDCTVEEYYDHMRLYVALMTMDMIGSHRGKRGPMMPFDCVRPTPAFLYTNTWVWPDDHSGFWTLPIMYRLHLSQLSVRAALRAEMDDEQAYAHTLELQRELDSLQASLPEALKKALAHPERQAKRSVFALFMSRLYSQHMLVSWHHPYYVQGWRDPRRRKSVEEVFLHSRAYLETFLALWAYLAPDYPIDSLTPPVAREVIESHPHVGFNMSLLATPVLSISALLRHHLILTDLNPQGIIPCRSKERDEVHALLGRMTKLTFLLSPMSSVHTAPRRSAGLHSMPHMDLTPTSSQSHPPSPVVGKVSNLAALPTHNLATPVAASYSSEQTAPIQPPDQPDMCPSPLWPSTAVWESCLRAVPDVPPFLWPSSEAPARQPWT